MMTETETSILPGNSVFVENISPSATEKTIADFFSFCGKITNLTLRNREDRGSDAIITFETEAAAKTALLLTNALIVDRPILVSAYREELHPKPTSNDDSVTSTVELKGEQIQNRPQPLPAEQRTKTSVIASMLAAGYTLGADAVASARKIDEQNGLTQRLGVAADAVKDAVKKIDDSIHFTETMETISTEIAIKAKALDETLGISQTASTVRKSMDDGVGTLKETPTWQVSMGKLNEFGTGITNLWQQNVLPSINEIKTQSLTLIEEKRRQREAIDQTPNNTSVPSDVSVNDFHMTDPKATSL